MHQKGILYESRPLVKTLAYAHQNAGEWFTVYLTKGHQDVGDSEAPRAAVA